MNDRLRNLQLCELELLDEFIRICDKYGLRYCLLGGTMIGAVRHHGFIPWDDDVDVGMPRADYEKFEYLCRTELKTGYFYQSSATDPHYFLTYAKLRKNDTYVHEARFENAKFHKGVFIDIFPLDSCPKPGLLSHFMFNVLAVMNYRGQVDSGEAYRAYDELVGKAGYLVLRLFSPDRLVRLRRKLLRLLERMSDGTWIASYSGGYGYYKETYPSDWFFPTVNVEFEGRPHPVPAQYDRILSRSYGTYMTLPPEEDRVWHIQLEKSVF